MAVDPGPYSWEPHLAAWVLVIVGVCAVTIDHWRPQRSASGERFMWPHHRIVCFVVAAVGTVVALTWPVADLAAHWSLTLLVVQRLLLLLLVAPMLLLGLPDDILLQVTRPALVDAVLTRLQRPPVAIAVVTVVSVGSMTPALVRAQASGWLARGLIDGSILAAGLVLWVPVIGRLPGIPRPKPIVRFGYLVFQAVVPAFLSFIYIFSRHPLYHTFSESRAALHLRPLTDQQVAGFVSKLTMLIVLLSVGAVVLARASRADDNLVLDEPLVWTDVQRAFERADRQRSRLRDPGLLEPPPVGDPGGAESSDSSAGTEDGRMTPGQGGPGLGDDQQPGPS